MDHKKAVEVSRENCRRLGLPFTEPTGPAVAYIMQEGSLFYECPACGHSHLIPTTPEASTPGGPVWNWNGRIDSPTLSPSIKATRYDPEPEVCHHFLTAGIVDVCGDSAKHAGEKLPLAAFALVE